MQGRSPSGQGMTGTQVVLQHLRHVVSDDIGVEAVGIEQYLTTGIHYLVAGSSGGWQQRSLFRTGSRHASLGSGASCLLCLDRNGEEEGEDEVKERERSVHAVMY